MMHVFINGRVAILVQYCEEHYGEVDGGARIDIRRVESYEGTAHREGAEGFRILPVGDGGIYRIDLSRRIDVEVPKDRFHHHPNYKDGDVGPRVFDQEFASDPMGWTERRLLDLPTILAERGHSDLLADFDKDQMVRTLPLIMAAVEASLKP